MIQRRAKIGGKNQKFTKKGYMIGYIKKNPFASVERILQSPDHNH
jgi:hypothetical protein